MSNMCNMILKLVAVLSLNKLNKVGGFIVFSQGLFPLRFYLSLCANSGHVKTIMLLYNLS